VPKHGRNRPRPTEARGNSHDRDRHPKIFVCAEACEPAGFWRDRDAAAAVEFALVAAPFLALILAIIQVGLIIYATQSLQTAAAAASRLILTGQVQTQNMSPSDFGQAVCGDASLFTCSGLMIDVRTYSSFSGADASMPTLTYDAHGNVSNSWQYNPGGPGDIVVMRLMYRWPVIMGPLGLNLSNLGDGYRLLMATSAFKNEPYQ
jgi:Flp pilus assembly protein TadG